MYKVVRNIDGIRRSIISSPLGITYNTNGKWTKPPEKYVANGYGILAFVELADAIAFLLPFSGVTQIEIWKVRTHARLALPLNNIDVARCLVWGRTPDPVFEPTYVWPKGTRMSESICLDSLVVVFHAWRIECCTKS